MRTLRLHFGGEDKPVVGQSMELFYSDKYIVLHHDGESLWVNRENGTFSTKMGEVTAESNPTLSLIGKVYGFIGVLKLSSAAEPRLVFIKSQEEVCKIKGHEIYKITSVISVPLESECELEVEIHHSTKTEKECVHISPVGAQTLPSVLSHGPHGLTEVVSSVISWNKIRIPPCPNSRKYGGRSDRTERRLLDEFYKMFMEADSFYYSNKYDIFNSLQRQTSSQTSSESVESAKNDRNNKIRSEASEADINKSDNNNTIQNTESRPMWKTVDERFFWNRYMLSDIAESEDVNLHRWAVPILQGSIQHKICQLDPNSARVTQNDSEIPSDLELLLISRRSKYRAGMRYLKRGVDENGKVANYVETEQIMVFRGHMISFVQTRGSVPVYWSQPGYKYRPPIRLDKPVEESFPAFEKHMQEELNIYGRTILVNLVEKNGKERVLEEAYRKCVLNFDAEDVTYVTFDFHDRCRGLKFDNVKMLTEKITDVIKGVGYCWVDSYGVVMQQNGTFRVNCVDCLDRTNVVQSFIAKEVLSHQLSKVGLFLPEIGLVDTIRMSFLEIWANNGDIISKQYAGTAALKGDFTRTGERRFAGVMRDGMNSANRYLNNRLKDGTRQACIDLILGIRSSVTEEELTLGKEAVEEKEITTDLIMQMIDDVKHTVVPVNSVIVGSWGLVNAKLNEVGSFEVDSVLILTENDVFIAIYDCSLDIIASSTHIPLASIISLEILNEPVSHHNVSNMWGFFHAAAPSNSQAHVPSLKIHFANEDGTKDYFHFRSSNLRFFNNCLTPITHPDEMTDALKLLAETLKATVNSSSNKVIHITHAVTPTPSKTNQRGLPGINMWIPKWNSAAPASPSQPEANVEPSSRKFSPASMQRFTPNFLKKKRTNAPVVNDEILVDLSSKEGTVSIEQAQDALQEQSLKTPTMLPCTGLDPSSLFSVAHHATTPVVESSSTINEEMMDLFIPSCGIISIPVRSAVGLHIGLTPELLGGSKASPGLSPATPIMDGTLVASQDVTPTSTDTSSSFRLHIPQDLLQRHRFSLPTNSLSIVGNSPSKQRSTTPEIRITEEPSQNTPLMTLLGSTPMNIANQKRMSRSSEDVHKTTSVGIGANILNAAFMNKVPLTLRTKLAPTNLQQDSRSTSEQDIFSSTVNMKGSHSESAIKDGNPAPRRDVVFAPLGKLARGMQNIGVNYLDPRKLRDTLRQPRQDVVPQEDPEMMEKMKTCKSKIIDV